MEESGSSDDDDPGNLVPKEHLEALHASLQRCLEREKASREQAHQAHGIIVALKEEVAQLRAAMERLEREHFPSAPNAKRRKTKTQKRTTPLPTPTSNSFDALSTDDAPPDLPDETQTITTPAPTPNTPQNPTVTILNSTSPPTHKPTDKIPPIILHDKDIWMTVSNILNTNKASYTRATNTREGIRIIPSSISDYRQIHQILTKADHSFHSYQLPSEKTIKVVIRGVPQSLSNQQILTDLTKQSYIPLLVTRLNGRNDRPAPLILVQLERKFQSIFNLKTLCGLDITVEAKKIPSGPLQCHRCQRFGHTQPNCHAPYRCMKCADSHSTHLCPKPSTTPAVCANCKADHISSHHSCTLNPVNLRKTYASTLKPNTSATPKPTQAQKPQPAPKPQPTTAPNPNPTATPNFATLSFPLYEALLSSSPTPERITAFTTQLTFLKRILDQS